jgi:hypothetical protein
MHITPNDLAALAAGLDLDGLDLDLSRLEPVDVAELAAGLDTPPDRPERPPSPARTAPRVTGLSA